MKTTASKTQTLLCLKIRKWVLAVVKPLTHRPMDKGRKIICWDSCFRGCFHWMWSINV